MKLITRKENPPIVGTYVTNWELYPYPTNTRNFYYSSASVRTKDKYLYGKFEIRCKIPEGTTNGFFPAFWLYGDWDISGEKDN